MTVKYGRKEIQGEITEIELIFTIVEQKTCELLCCQLLALSPLSMCLIKVATHLITGTCTV